MTISTIAAITALPKNLPLNGAIEIELQDGVMIFRASHSIQEHIECLLEKREIITLTEIEEQELDDFVALDDYLSFVNRMIRNNFLLENTIKIQSELEHGA